MVLPSDTITDGPLMDGTGMGGELLEEAGDRARAGDLEEAGDRARAGDPEEAGDLETNGAVHPGKVVI